MLDTVKYGISDSSLSDILIPLVVWQLRGDDNGLLFTPVIKQCQQCQASCLVNGVQCKVVEDKQVVFVEFLEKLASAS